MNINSYIHRHCTPILLLMALLILTGCFSNIKGWSQESFRSPDFSNDSLNKGGLALLPVIILEDTYQKDSESGSQIPAAPYAQTSPQKSTKEDKAVITYDAYRIILNEILMSNIQSRRPSFRIVSPSDTLKRINDEGLTDVYRTFNSNFPKVGFDSALLKKFGKTLNSRYIFISQVVVTESKSEASLIVIWTFGRKSILRSVKISGQIWDTAADRQVWEGFGVGYNRLSSYEKTPLFEEIASKAVESLLKNVMP
jgi:hypothetical protein